MISEKTFHRWLNVTLWAGILAAVLVSGFFFRTFHIPSSSMEPTLMTGDVIVVRKNAKPKRGDVVVFSYTANDRYYVKRCVAMEGDTVSIHDGKLWVNGVAQEEPYLNDTYIYGDLAEQTVPDGCFFALGDNRNSSVDSRIFGCVELKAILGVVNGKV